MRLMWAARAWWVRAGAPNGFPLAVDEVNGVPPPRVGADERSETGRKDEGDESGSSHQKAGSDADPHSSVHSWMIIRKSFVVFVVVVVVFYHYYCHHALVGPTPAEQ